MRGLARVMAACGDILRGEGLLISILFLENALTAIGIKVSEGVFTFNYGQARGVEGRCVDAVFYVVELEAFWRDAEESSYETPANSHPRRRRASAPVLQGRYG